MIAPRLEQGISRPRSVGCDGDFGRSCHRQADRHTRTAPASPTTKAKGGGLIIGLNRSAIATLIDRTSRFAMLVPLPRQTGYGLINSKKNGPAWAGYGAVTMKNALVRTFEVLPPSLRRSLA